MNIINQLSEIQDKLKIISAYLETNNLKEEEKMESLNELRIIEAIVSKPIDNHEKSIKSALELTDTVSFGIYNYSFTRTNRSVFDADKAKNTLKACNYQIEDFYKSQESKKLTYKLIDQNQYETIN
jgi:hypothetical protein